ncbi:hypothetical protein BU17DRAFT_83702 [Hysterangium stoloniferum]|nr:hypothetical protein BU17DRAFT_83702 [Hysterangium stoloniferum]
MPGDCLDGPELRHSSAVWRPNRCPILTERTLALSRAQVIVEYSTGLAESDSLDTDRPKYRGLKSSTEGNVFNLTNIPPKHPIGANRASACHDPDANVLLDDEAEKHRSIIFKRQSLIKISGNPPHLPSSQEAAVELLINLDNDSSAASDETNPLPAASAQPSPSKARSISIIARIKANAEIQAAAQAQQERNLSLLGSTDDGSDLSDPKMDSPESDESGLELELDTIVKRLDARLSSPASAHTNEANTRRSTRHLPNRDVKVESFRDDSPRPTHT